MVINIMQRVGSPSNKKTIITAALSLIVIVSLYSYITALLAFISPSSNLRWEGSVSYIGPSPFSPGESVTITGAVEEATQYIFDGDYYFFIGSEDIRWFIVVIDPNYKPIHYATGTLSDFSGSGDLSTVNFNLPSNAVIGTYKVRVFVWTDYLPGGETRTLNILEEEFEVA